MRNSSLERETGAVFQTCQFIRDFVMKMAHDFSEERPPIREVLKQFKAWEAELDKLESPLNHILNPKDQDSDRNEEKKLEDTDTSKKEVKTDPDHSDQREASMNEQDRSETKESERLVKDPEFENNHSFNKDL